MKPRHSQGFTLIEVLVALAVVATALYAATGSVRSAARGSGHLEQSTLAHWAALNALNETKLALSNAETADQAQTVTLYGNEFMVSLQRAPADKTRIVRVTVKVASAATPEMVLYTLHAVLP